MSSPSGGQKPSEKPEIDYSDWLDIKNALRNYVFNNFNPSLLPSDNALRQDIFDKISSTAGLFLALEPQVFVSKIRCRVFRTWRSAENYYANSLRQLSRALEGRDAALDEDDHQESRSEGIVAA